MLPWRKIGKEVNIFITLTINIFFVLFYFVFELLLIRE